jgi:hypothetical protein
MYNRPLLHLCDALSERMVGPRATDHTSSSARMIITHAPALRTLRISRMKQVGGACHMFPKLGRPSLSGPFLTHWCGVPLHYKREAPWSDKGLEPTLHTDMIAHSNARVVSHEHWWAILQKYIMQNEGAMEAMTFERWDWKGGQRSNDWNTELMWHSCIFREFIHNCT